MIKSIKRLHSMQTKLVLVPDTKWVQKRGGGGGEGGGRGGSGSLEPRNHNIFAVTLGVKSLSLAGVGKMLILVKWVLGALNP